MDECESLQSVRETGDGVAGTLNTNELTRHDPDGSKSPTRFAPAVTFPTPMSARWSRAGVCSFVALRLSLPREVVTICPELAPALSYGL
jgi:hypothetical protein